MKQWCLASLKGSWSFLIRDTTNIHVVNSCNEIANSSSIQSLCHSIPSCTARRAAWGTDSRSFLSLWSVILNCRQRMSWQTCCWLMELYKSLFKKILVNFVVTYDKRNQRSRSCRWIVFENSPDLVKVSEQNLHSWRLLIGESWTLFHKWQLDIPSGHSFHFR